MYGDTKTAKDRLPPKPVKKTGVYGDVKTAQDRLSDIKKKVLSAKKKK
jgi:hypothetical protein